MEHNKPANTTVESQPELEPYLSEGELCVRLRKCERSLFSWRAKGFGPAFYKVGKMIRYPVAAVEEFEKSLVHTVPIPAPTSSISEAELCLRWSKSARHLRFLKKAGEMPPHFKIGQTIRYLLAEVEKFESANSKS